MRRFQPYSAVVNALRESKDLVVVDDGDYSGTGKEAVKRKEPLTVPTEEGDAENKPSTTDLFHRLRKASSNKLETSVYVKDFGSADDAGQIALEQFFRPYGAVMVRKRRDDDDGSWKGSVFVEFDSEDSQKQFLALDPAPKFNDNQLVIMGKKEYIIMKCKEKNIEPDFENHGRRPYNGNNSRGRGGNRGGDRGDRGGRGRGNGRGRGRGGFDRRDDRRDRSPRRQRNRSGSVDSRDWNDRRDRFQKGKDDRGSKKDEDRKDVKDVERDGHGVPVVKDSRTDAEIAAASKKRKGDDEERADSPKKGKLEIKQDE
jgi:lupus La protein